MKILVTGACGQLGSDVMNELSKRGHISIGSDIHEVSKFQNYVKLDITNKKMVNKVINNVKPDAIIHCAAWTNVDEAEDLKNRELVQKINVEGTKNISIQCEKMNIKMMYISTDYVFDGKGKKPWKPDCKEYSPLNYYGQTKLEGELAVSSLLTNFFIVRISWVFGKNGKNFVDKMIELYQKGYKELRIVDDQIGTPTYTTDLSRLLVDMIESDKYGYYNATNEGGYISWARFAKKIFKLAGLKMKINKVSTAEYGVSKALRPFNSRLDKSKLSKNGFKRLPSWKHALKQYLKEKRIYICDKR